MPPRPAPRPQALARTIVAVGLAGGLVLGGVGCAPAKPSKDEVKSGLHRAWDPWGTGISPFIDCLVEQSYEKLSADAISAVARVQSQGDLDKVNAQMSAADKEVVTAASKSCQGG